MKDLWDIADQRDWYYEEYRKLKDGIVSEKELFFIKCKELKYKLT